MREYLFVYVFSTIDGRSGNGNIFLKLNVTPSRKDIKEIEKELKESETSWQNAVITNFIELRSEDE